MIYIVLGMHKSGTTLVSKILHKSGICMGDFDEKIAYDSGNHFERKETKDLNKRILNCADDFSLLVKNPVKPEMVDDYYLKIMQEIIIRNNRKLKNWGFKDPRTCLTYAIWKAKLTAHRVIFIYRHPFEVWSHYTKNRRLKSFVNRFWGSLQTWYVYNQEVLKHLPYWGRRGITINYQALMNSNDQEFKRLEKFIGQKLCDAREISLQRYRFRKEKIPTYNFVCHILNRFFSNDINSLFEQFEEMRKIEIDDL